MILLDLLALIAFGLALIPFYLYFRNIFIYREPDTTLLNTPPKVSPKVSILIPARNEEKSIGPAIESCLQSEVAVLEVLVLDDHSSDQTGVIVHQLVERDRRVKLLTAPPLPANWCGKQFACFQLSQNAQYDLLLFMDADVRLSKDCLSRLTAYFIRNRCDLLSGFPAQETKSFVEKLVIPLIHFVLLGFLPIWTSRKKNNPSLAAGCGQLFLTSKHSYQKMGGHEQIKYSRHDGITLPQAYRRAGLKTDICDVTTLATCRMYRSAKEVFFGFAKNACEGFAKMPLLLFMTIVFFIGQIFPAIILLGLIFQWVDIIPESTINDEPISSQVNQLTTSGQSTFIIALLLSYSIRFHAVYRFQQSWLGAIFHPLGISILLSIQWYAITMKWFGKPIGWKGRS